ncbi:hypothetical protein AAVH_15158 [Aphelenchoides avenae]|nr:hypothetical protein AAVH_15158 [Aphelenchus avenae]
MVQSLKDGMDLLGNVSSRSGKDEPCMETTTKKPYREATTKEPYAMGVTTSDVDGSRHKDDNSFAKDVIDAETDRLRPKSWKDRQGLHEAVANGIVQRFNGPENTKNYRFEALAYLPYKGDERRAFIKLPDNMDVVRSEYASVNYVVTRRLSVGSKVTNQWASIGTNANDILEATFSTRATNLTARMKEVEKRFGPFVTQDGFRALAALRCGYEFVWYQLGYRYFPAGYATGKLYSLH